MQPTVITAKPLEAKIRVLLDRNDQDELRRFLNSLKAPDLADVLDRLSDSERTFAFSMLSPPLAAATLAEVSPESKRLLIGTLSRQELAEVLKYLPLDDVTRLIIDVPSREKDILAEVSSEVVQEVINNLQYPPSSAGRLMTEKFVSVQPSMTAQEAIEHLREIHRDAETFTDVYAVDEDGHLEGVSSLRDLIMALPSQKVAEFMTTDVVTVAPTDDQELAARLIAHYNFLALPVTREGRILGIITVDDIIDVLIEEGTEDQLRFGGVEPGVINQPYFTTPIWRVVRSRVGWLVLLFVAETATGTVLRHFEDELARVVALSFFIPLLIGTGGNTGAQTVSTIIRGLALKEIRLRDTARVVLRELWSGLLLGLTLGVIAFTRAELWGSGHQLSMVVALAIIAICTWANTIGSLIPLAAQRFKIDPALVSAPLITTLVDATGLAIYLMIAKVLLSALR